MNKINGKYLNIKKYKDGEILIMKNNFDQLWLNKEEFLELKDLFNNKNFVEDAIDIKLQKSVEEKKE